MSFTVLPLSSIRFDTAGKQSQPKESVLENTVVPDIYKHALSARSNEAML